MRVRTLAFFSVVSTVVLLAPAAQAGGMSHSITADPTALRPTESTTVTGTSDCNSSAYVVTLTYTNPDGDPATVTANGTSDATGEYTQAIAVPETATAGEPASVSSNFASCGGGGAAASNTVTLTINAWEGTISATPDEGEAGTEVSINGTACYGDDIVVVFYNDSGEDEVTDVTLNDDRTFTATYVIPDVDAGEYAFSAACPGSDFPDEPFTVVAGEEETVPPPAAPPATPVGGTPTFTG